MHQLHAMHAATSHRSSQLDPTLHRMFGPQTVMSWAALLVGWPRVHAYIRLNGIFTSHMVLQTPHPGLPPARIFGLGYTSEQIVIEGSSGFPGPFTVTPRKTGDAHWPQPQGAPWGNWSVNLTEVLTSPGPYTITISSKQNATDVTVLEDVFFGEVSSLRIRRLCIASLCLCYHFVPCRYSSAMDRAI